MIVIGWDTGSAYCAHCTLDVTATSATYIDGAVIEVGHMVKLAKPRRFRDGRQQTAERVVLGEDIGEFYSRAKGYLGIIRGGLAWPSVGHVAKGELCAIERRPRVSPRGKGKTLSAEMATQLKTSEGLAMLVYGVARDLGYSVALASPEETRKAACGNAHADDAAVAAFCKLAIQNWPKVSNSHVRDAAIVALLCARRECR